MCCENETKRKEENHKIATLVTTNDYDHEFIGLLFFFFCSVVLLVWCCLLQLLNCLLVVVRWILIHYFGFVSFSFSLTSSSSLHCHSTVYFGTRRRRHDIFPFRKLILELISERGTETATLSLSRV